MTSHGAAVAGPSRRAEETAFRIAEAAADTWYRHAGGVRRPEVMIGTVAALLLWRAERPDAPDAGPALLEMSEKKVLAWMRQVWGAAWIAHPDLISSAEVLHRWLDEDGDRLARPVAETVAAVVRAGAINPYATLMRHDADLLGLIVQQSQSRWAQTAGGVFYTPGDMADVVVRLQMSGATPVPGQLLGDPCAGTGGLARAAAQYLREIGVEPASMRWVLNDIDPVASACSAVNALVWGLGPSVLIGCVDILAEPDWEKAAIEQAKAAIEHRDQLWGDAGRLALIRRLLALETPEMAA